MLKHTSFDKALSMDIEFIPDMQLLDLGVYENTIQGVVARNIRTGDIVGITAKAVVLAVGGYSRISWQRTSSPLGIHLSLFRQDWTAAVFMLYIQHMMLSLTARITKESRDAGADVIVTPCPLCQMQLDIHQEAGTVPVLHLLQLAGMTFGYDQEPLGMNRLLNKFPLKF